MNRRNYLLTVGAVGTTTIAGCSSDDPEYEEGEVPDETEEETDVEQTQEPGDEFFEFRDVTPNGATFLVDEEISIGAELENTGEAVGEQNVEIIIEGQSADDAQFELRPGERTNPGITYNPNAWDPGSYDFVVSSEDDEISGSFTVQEPEPEPDADDIEIDEHEMVINEGDYIDEVYVEGIVSNNADEIAEYVQVTVRIYDEAGNQLDSYIDNTNDLAAGGTWAFEVMVLEESENIDNYDIAVEDIRW